MGKRRLDIFIDPRALKALAEDFEADRKDVPKILEKPVRDGMKNLIKSVKKYTPGRIADGWESVSQARVRISRDGNISIEVGNTADNAVINGKPVKLAYVVNYGHVSRNQWNVNSPNGYTVRRYNSKGVARVKTPEPFRGEYAGEEYKDAYGKGKGTFIGKKVFRQKRMLASKRKTFVYGLFFVQRGVIDFMGSEYHAELKDLLGGHFTRFLMRRG